MTGDEFRARLAALGLSQSGMARLMVRLGDKRMEKNVVRSIQRMVASDSRVSSEMAALLGVLGRSPDLVQELGRPWHPVGRRAAVWSGPGTRPPKPTALPGGNSSAPPATRSRDCVNTEQ
jgi:hypothetical protein